MENIRGSTIILNGKPVEASVYNLNTFAASIYEVIRVINGKFIFLEDHLRRLEISCFKSGIACPAKETLNNQLELLVRYQLIKEGNVKLILDNSGEQVQTACFFIPHFYPSESDYKNGVRTNTYKFERPNPNVKKWNEAFRKNVNHFIHSKKIYEAILLNNDNIITEGSRSNLFFIDKEERIITAPESIILPGITRSYVQQICKKEQIDFIEKEILLEEISTYPASFISGTSPKILPVKNIDEIKFNIHSGPLKVLMSAYEKLISDQLNK